MPPSSQSLPDLSPNVPPALNKPITTAVQFEQVMSMVNGTAARFVNDELLRNKGGAGTFVAWKTHFKRDIEEGIATLNETFVSLHSGVNAEHWVQTVQTRDQLSLRDSTSILWYTVGERMKNVILTIRDELDKAHKKRRGAKAWGLADFLLHLAKVCQYPAQPSLRLD